MRIIAAFEESDGVGLFIESDVVDAIWQQMATIPSIMVVSAMS